MMLSITRVRIALTALAMTPLAVGCAALETGGTSSASCVFAVDYDDRVYIDAGKVDHTLGAEVGTARDSVCDDTGGDEEDQVAVEDLTAYTAYAIKGIDTEDAIAVRESPGDEVRVLIHMTEDGGVNEAAERLFGSDEQGGEDDAGGPDSGDSDSGSGESPEKCALVVEYGKDSYSNHGDARIELGAKAGKARAVPCGDTPGEVDPSAEPAAFQAYEVKGLDPADAIAIRFSADEEPFLMVRMDDDLPPEVEELLPAEER
ncbi:DUF6281 family protein [Streptomyces europaeiscabiei]|uniref:DUF6281 family protein n=1 Tax=Streptomyces europaeiscabiei TaxID=146819 RepID=A0ABU4NL32_9ACTN|nr:DUF6281 family protein [Streptomyces europaeiscabiei]MDX3546222.1 DUF6281 family protein [Streptomyces europaeiscabiei]MDX3557472.1 DUF6281 family protein [Streptomyces europaeiscabiei]MDX3703621.1 DUF6281 family protein [Streptomyces europaeiscabiei]